MSKRFLFVMWEGGGTVPPELAVARRLVARGHRVRVLADPTIELEALTVGCEFHTWTTAPHRVSRDRTADIFKDYEFKNPIAMIDAYLQEFLARPALRWAADVQAALDRHAVDAVVVDFAIPAALIPASRLGLPTATLVPNIWVVPTRGIPPLGPGWQPAKSAVGRAREAILRALVERVFSRALPPLNATRIEYGLPPVGRVYDQLLGADEILVLTSPLFDFTSPHMPPHVRYGGPQLDDPSWAEPWQSPFPADDSRPLVLVAFSSTFQNQTGVLRRVVEALSGLPVRGLVTLGPAIAPEEVPTRGSNVVVVQSAPHVQVLERASLLITHAGHGSALKGLAAGVPLVCMPMGRDQHDTAARVVYRGAGERLDARASPARIAAAVERVLATPRYAEAARRLQRGIASGEGCVDVVARLEQLASMAAAGTPTRTASTRCSPGS